MILTGLNSRLKWITKISYLSCQLSISGYIFYPKLFFLKMNVSRTKTKSRWNQIKWGNPRTIHVWERAFCEGGSRPRKAQAWRWEKGKSAQIKFKNCLNNSNLKKKRKVSKESETRGRIRSWGRGRLSACLLRLRGKASRQVGGSPHTTMPRRAKQGDKCFNKRDYTVPGVTRKTQK